jgi:hypothetical protein
MHISKGLILCEMQNIGERVECLRFVHLVDDLLGDLGRADIVCTGCQRLFNIRYLCRPGLIHNSSGPTSKSVARGI